MRMGDDIHHYLLSVLAYLQITQTDIQKKKMRIPGLSFSWKRAVGISGARQKIAHATGIPTTRHGLERKIGAMVLGALLGKKKRR